MLYGLLYMWNPKQTKTTTTKLIDVENRLVVVRGMSWRVGEMGEEGQKVQS